MRKRNYFYIVVIGLIGCFAGLFVYHTHEEKEINYLIRKLQVRLLKSETRVYPRYLSIVIRLLNHC